MDNTSVSIFKTALRRLNEEETHVIFQNFRIEKCKYFHPLQEIDRTLSTLPILLAFREASSQGAQSSSQSFVNNSSEKSRLDSHSSADTSFGGSPLKLPEFGSVEHAATPTNSFNETYIPVSVKNARYLISLYNVTTDPNLQDSPDRKPVPPLWVLCDCTSPECGCLMGCQWCKDGSVTTLKGYTVTVQGPFTEKNKIPKLFIQGRILGSVNARQLDAQCSARYNVLSSSVSQEATQDLQQGSLNISVQWNKLTCLFQTPPPDAQVIVEAQVAAGDMRSAAYALHTELCMLKGFVNGLEGTAQWMASNHISVMDSIKKLMEEQKIGETFIAPEDDDILSPHNIVVLVERKDLDFAEQLWIILKECGSLSELISCLQCVLHGLQQGAIQPMVHKSNVSSLASLIRDSYYNKMKMPILSGALPLQMLVELGIEKLKRDYMHALVAKELLTAEQLSYFVVSNLSPQEQVCRLEKLHHVVELVVLLEKFLNLPKISLTISARNAMKYYESNDVTGDHIFCVPVNIRSISTFLEKHKPYTWCAKIISRSCGQDVHTVAQLSTSPCFDHVRQKNDSVANIKILQEEEKIIDDLEQIHLSSYYYTQVKETIHVFED